MNRRSFLTGLGSLIAVPAVVKVTSLMPIRGIVMDVTPVTLTEHVEQQFASLVSWRSHLDMVREYNELLSGVPYYWPAEIKSLPKHVSG